MRISDWSSDVCSSDLGRAISVGVVIKDKPRLLLALARQGQVTHGRDVDRLVAVEGADARQEIAEREDAFHTLFGDAEGHRNIGDLAAFLDQPREAFPARHLRSEEHTSELQSLMRS